MFHTVMTGLLMMLVLSLSAAETIDSPIGTGSPENNGDFGDANLVNIGQPLVWKLVRGERCTSRRWRTTG